MQWYKDHPRDLEAVQKSIREGLASCLPNHPGINYVEALETTLLWRSVQIAGLQDEIRKLEVKVDKLRYLLSEIEKLARDHASGDDSAFLAQCLQAVMGFCDATKIFPYLFPEEADSEQEAY